MLFNVDVVGLSGMLNAQCADIAVGEAMQ